MADPAGPAPLILVADDVPANVELLCDQLATLGYRVETATDGPSAVEACFAKKPDLCILDVSMPAGSLGVDDRSTGFLMPTYGTSTFRGKAISNAFFWAINRSQDATFLHDWYSQTGQGVGAEYRYLAAPGSEGQLRFYNLREHEATYTEGGSTVTTPERRSYEIRGSLSQRLSRTFRA